MAKIKHFEDLESWKSARDLVREIYRVSSSGGLEREFFLKNQIKRASVSIMSNISEGFKRDGNREFIQFLSNAKGSCGEVRSQLYILKDQGFIDAETFETLSQMAVRINKMINGLIKYLKNSDYKGKKFRDD